MKSKLESSFAAMDLPGCSVTTHTGCRIHRIAEKTISENLVLELLKEISTKRDLLTIN